jgi:hypothetical protein
MTEKDGNGAACGVRFVCGRTRAAGLEYENAPQCTSGGVPNYVIESDVHESNGPNVSILRGFSSFHSKNSISVLVMLP